MTRYRPRMAAGVIALTLLALAPSATAQTQTFSGGGPLSFGEMSATPYPSTLDVAGMGGTLTDVNVTLSGVTLAATDLDMLLVSPSGAATLLTSDVPTAEILSQNWTFDDQASLLQVANQLTGIFKPTNLDPLVSDSDVLPPPAPEGAETLSALNGGNPNGTWKLYAADSGVVAPIGSITGWTLQLTTTATGLANPLPAAKDFGTVFTGTTSTPQTFTIANAGDAAMQFTAVELQGADASSFVIGANSCLGQTIAAVMTCSIDVAFKPVSAGAKNAALFLGDDTGGVGKLISLSGIGLDPVLSTQPDNNQQQQRPPSKPPGTTETGSNQIEIPAAGFSTPPAAGQPTTLHVETSDDKAPVTGILVDFGESLGVYGASSCVEGATKGNSAAFDIPYTFTTPGSHTIKVTVFSGGCGKATARTITFSMTVETQKAARRIARSADTIAGPDITSKCKNATMLPSANKKKAKLLLKALLCVMNEQRKLAKLKPLKISKKLTKAALAHTRSMISGQFFAHQGPKEAALASRLKKAKYRGAAGENIGAGGGPLGSPLGMVNGWMHSTLHRANILEKNWKTVGIGFLAQFPLPTASQPVATFTTDFGTKP